MYYISIIIHEYGRVILQLQHTIVKHFEKVRKSKSVSRRTGLINPLINNDMFDSRDAHKSIHIFIIKKWKPDWINVNWPHEFGSLSSWYKYPFINYNIIKFQYIARRN